MAPQNNEYFVNLIHSGSDLEEQLVMESQYFNQNSQVFTQETQLTNEIGSISKKQRGGNFTMEEDKLLVSAWLNISMDPIQGNDQKKTKFWQRVKEFIDESKQFDSNRTENSLMNRWSTIQLCTNKFCSCYAKVESLNQSDANEEDKVTMAKTMYKELNKSTFQFEHCWVRLKNQPKWFLDCEKKNKLKKLRKGLASYPSGLDSMNLENDNVATNNFVDLERPPGRNAEKERLLKRKNREMTSSVQIFGALDEMKECKNKLIEKKIEILDKTYAQEQEKICIKQEILGMEQSKEEERIIMMDLSGFSEEQQEYYRYRKMEILKKKKKRVQ